MKDKQKKIMECIFMRENGISIITLNKLYCIASKIKKGNIHQVFFLSKTQKYCCRSSPRIVCKTKHLCSRLDVRFQPKQKKLENKINEGFI